MRMDVLEEDKRPVLGSFKVTRSLSSAFLTPLSARRNTAALRERARQLITGGSVMRVLAYDRFKAGVTIETVQPYLPEEVANVWRLWKSGIVRENYARADEYGVVIAFEVDSVETARRYTEDFPLTRAGLIEWFFIALQAPLPLEALFDVAVDTKEPYDRTMTASVGSTGRLGA
jgi:hypothetical protein